MSNQNGWIAGRETLPEGSTFEVMPIDVRKRLVFLSREITLNQEELAIAERAYWKSKGDYELAMADSRVLYGRSVRDDGKPYSENQKEDYALRDNRELYLAYMACEASVRIVRAVGYALQTQVELTQSTSASIKAEISLSGSDH